MKKWFARSFLKLGGWEIIGERPTPHRFVLIAAPHTSNWDFPNMLAFATVFDLKVTWLAKHSLFWPPLGWLMRALGGVPVDRSRNRNLVAYMVDAFNGQSELALVVPTEGTRAKAEFWKSGFYHIAQGAGVPIVPSFLDYGRKRGGFGPALIPTGNLQDDMQYFRDFYDGMEGKFPELFGPIRMREENTGSTTSAGGDGKRQELPKRQQGG